MSNRLRGLIPAYKAGRLDEFIRLRFGDYEGYLEYVLRRIHFTWKRRKHGSKITHVILDEFGDYPKYIPTTMPPGTWQRSEK